ncbi:MAG: hypothetical protein QNJ73_16480 [Gammaproteobacteria bacterium]|nr:hypothetical protein [Gammaproteobacteria bacterium]
MLRLKLPDATPANSADSPTAEIGGSLQAYLAQLDDFPAISALARLEASENTRLDADLTLQLLAELGCLDQAVFHRSLTELTGSFAGRGSNERVDWPDLAIFCEDLRNILEAAAANGTGIIVTGMPG